MLNQTLSDEDRHDFESALELAGYGRFHYWLAFICGWANASDAVEILCISFLLPSAGSVHSLKNLSFLLLYFSECDLELTPARKGWLSAILFVGMMIGGRLIWITGYSLDLCDFRRIHMGIIS